MQEAYLHYAFKTKLLGNKFITTNNQQVEVVKFGYHNHNAGPDFLECQAKIDDKIWAGQIEFHVKSSDWLKHNHHKDKNYNNVILHFVFEHDTEIKSGQLTLPTVELKSLINQNHYNKYQSYITSKHWVACQNDIKKIDEFIIYQQKEKALINRLQRKSSQIIDLINVNNGDRKKVFFIQLFKAFGTKVNQQAFQQLGYLFDWRIIAKLNFDNFKIQAYVFGLAGFLNQDIDDEYFLNLKNEFQYLKQLFKFKEMNLSHWKFSTMRPSNFPTVRLAQLCEVLSNQINLSVNDDIDEFKNHLKINLNDYWKQHYNFNKIGKKTTPNLTPSFIDLILINVYIPYVFSLAILADDENKKLTTYEWLEQIKPEKNSIIRQWKSMDIEVKSAFDSQALIEQKNEFCKHHKCLKCNIGVNLLKK